MMFSDRMYEWTFVRLFTVHGLLRGKPLEKQCTLGTVALDGAEVEQADEREWSVKV